MNLVMLLEMAAETFPDRIAVKSGNESLTYAELQRAAWAAAQRIRGSGCRYLGLVDISSIAVPVAIQGTPDVFPALKRLRRARVTLTLGEPYRMDTGGGRASRAMLQQLTDDAMRRMAALLPESMRGVYA